MLKKIKLVHIITNLEVGGAQAVLYDLVASLDQKEYVHHIIYFRSGPYVQKLQQLGIHLYQIKGIIFFYDPLFFVRLYKQLKKIKPDCMHTLLWAANSSGRIMARLFKTPIVTVYHNNVDQDGIIRAIGDKITARIVPNIRVAVSPGIQESLYKRDGCKKSIVITNGIDCHQVQKDAQKYCISRRVLSCKDDDFIIGAVGRFQPVKNFSLLIEVFHLIFQEYKKVRLLLIGQGPEEYKLRNIAHTREINDRVHFIIGKSAIGYYPLFDCFVQTSDKEGISIALLEAICLAIPCVVTHAQKLHPVIDHEHNGLLVSAGNKQQCMQSIKYLIHNNHARIMLGLMGQKTVIKCFNKRKMVNLYDTLFKQQAQ